MNKKGFTLVELLAVIVIIGILGLIAVPNVLKYFNESRIQAMIVQENKLIESGDILVRDYCKNPVNSEYQLECDELYKHLSSEADEEIIDNDDDTYTRYICVSTLKDKEYYSEKLEFSGEDCSGVVVYRIDKDTDIQKDSFSVVKCGKDYKTIFENENTEDFDEFLESNTRADELSKVFPDCFDAQPTQPGEQPVQKEYQLTINFTEHNQYGQEVAEKINKKILAGTEITEEVPSYYTGTGENKEYFTSFVHSSSDNVIIEKNGEEKLEKPTIINNKINFKMPANNVTINVAYSINQYKITFVHQDAVLGTTTFGGSTHNNNTYDLFNGESVNIPYKDIDNFKIVSHNDGKQKQYILSAQENVLEYTEYIKYQQEKFNLSYNENGGDSCADEKVEYGKQFEELCNTTKTGYQFKSWSYNGTQISDATTGENRYYSSKTNNYYNDLTFDANWENNKYYVRYDCNGGAPTSPYESVHYYDTPSSLMENKCKKVGHYFSKWTSEGGQEPTYTDKKDIMNLTESNLGTVKLYATYSPHYLIVIYNPKDATTIKYQGNTKTEAQFKTESQSKYYYNVVTDTGLANVQNEEHIYLERKGYKATGNWYNGSIKLNQSTSVSGRTLAEHFGLDISSTNATLNVYPEWQIIDYTITYKLNGGSNPSGIKTKYTVEDSDYTLPSPTRTGYTFAGWYTTSDFSGSKVTKLTKGNTGNKEYYAKWTPNIYKVTLNNQGANVAGTTAYWYLFNTTKTINNETVYYYLDSTCTTPMTNYQITLPQKTGYTFGGYFTETNGNGTQFINKNGQAINNLYMSKSVDNTLYAKWTINSYQITYHLDGGSNPSGVKTNYSVNDEYTLPTPTKTGYTFAGWYTASNYSGSAVSKINKGSTGNKQYYAKWNPNKYKVTLNNQGATAAGTTQYWYYFNTTKVIDGETIYYYTNEACTTPMKNYTITPPTKTGYTFAGYFSGTNGTGTQYIESTGGAINNIYSTKAENTTLYAKWTTNTYTLTYNANGGSVTPSSKTVTYNAEYGTLPTPTRTGYTFAGWYTATTGGTQVTSGTKVTKTQNHTIYARWTANSGTKFTVKYYKQKADSTYPTTPNETKEYTGTTGATISCSDYKKTYTGFTYSSCKNSSGTSITTTTIAADGSAVINIYYSQNYVKVVYHTNGATTIKFKNVNKNEAQFVSETVQYINYEATASNGLVDVQNTSWVYLEKTGYKPTGYWKNSSGTKKMHQATSFTGKTLTENFGLNISNGSATLDLYADWEVNTVTYTATFVQNGAQSIGSTKQTCTAPVGGTCTVTTPTITPKSGFSVVGWDTVTDPKISDYRKLSESRGEPLDLSKYPCKTCIATSSTITLSQDATYYALTIYDTMYYVNYKKNSAHKNTTGKNIVYDPYNYEWGCHRINGESSCKVGLSYDMRTYLSGADTYFDVGGYSKTDNNLVPDYGPDEEVTLTGDITVYIIVIPLKYQTCTSTNKIYDKSSMAEVGKCTYNTKFIAEEWAYMPSDTTCEDKVYFYGYLQSNPSIKGWMCARYTDGRGFE